MTPEQILADLRDIHFPETTADAAFSELVLWPLALVFLTVIIVAWLIWRRRSLWRRDFYQELNRIEQIVDQHGEAEGWARLSRLLRRFAIQRQSRAEIAGLSGEPWLQRLDDVVGADLFTNGAWPWSHYLSLSPDRSR